MDTFTPTPTWTQTLTRTPSGTPTLVFSATPTRTFTRTATVTATHTPTHVLSATRTPSATDTRSPTPDYSPTISTTATPSRTNTPTRTRTPDWSATPTPTKTLTPVPAPATSTGTVIQSLGELDQVRLRHKIFTPGGAYPFLEISFSSRLSADRIQVTVFDLQGRRQARLPVTGSGSDYLALWDGRTESGQNAAPGVYVFEIKAGSGAYRSAVVLAR
jgi:hypothetical protein